MPARAQAWRKFGIVCAERPEPPLPFGVALHLGEILWGIIGSADRLDFITVGPAVNLVSRLEGLCRPLGRAVLVSGAFAAETSAPLVPLGTHALRGIAAPCAVFTVAENCRDRRDPIPASLVVVCVTGCGGTIILSDYSQCVEETWNDSQYRGDATGGGMSALFPVSSQTGSK